MNKIAVDVVSLADHRLWKALIDFTDSATNAGVCIGCVYVSPDCGHPFLL